MTTSRSVPGAAARPAGAAQQGNVRRAHTALGYSLRALTQAPENLAKVLTALGLAVLMESDSAPCPFCRHNGQLSLGVGRNGTTVLVVDHPCPATSMRFVPLPVAYAAIKTGKLQPLRGAAFAAWSARLLVAAGVLPPPPLPRANDTETLY